jgi:RHS repeat-associated protein
MASARGFRRVFRGVLSGRRTAWASRLFAVSAALALVAGTMPAATASAAPAAGAKFAPRQSAVVHSPPLEKVKSGKPPIGPAYIASQRRGVPRPVKVVGEIRARWSASTRVFQGVSGLVRLEQAPVPLNYHTGSGWEPIDNRLASEAGGWLVASRNSWTTRVGSASQGVSLSSSAGVLSLVPRGANGGASRAVKQSSAPPPSASVLAESPVPGSSKVTYWDAWRDTDMVDTVRSSGVSVDLVLKDAHAPGSFAFSVSGTTPIMFLDGGVGFTGNIGKTFEISPPRLALSKGSDATTASGIHYSLSGDRVVVSVDPRWLASLPKASFPVTIDPEITRQASSAAVSYSSSGGSAPGPSISIGNNGGVIWRAAVQFDFTVQSSLVNAGYRVYDAQIQIPGVNCYTSSSGCPVLVYDQGGQPGSYSAIGQGVPLVAGPWEGPQVHAGSDLDTYFRQGNLAPWFGVTADGTPYSTYSPTTPIMQVVDLFLPPVASRVVTIDGNPASNNMTVATSTPTLQASQIPANPDQYDYRQYDYQITTGDTPGSGLVFDSGNLCQAPSGSACNNPVPNVPTWPVPPGLLSDGQTYHAWVLTDWFANNVSIPKTVPPLSWGITFTVRLGLGSGGPSPTDKVGSVPGQSSTPATGAPGPGLPGSPFNVNLVNGNVSFSVATPKLSTVGGGVALGFTYNSAQVQSQALNEGLQGFYYNDATGDDPSADNVTKAGDVLVGERVDPIVNFDWGSSTAMAGQMPSEAVTRWTGFLNLQTTGTWALGDISSDGMDITFGTSNAYCPNNNLCLSDWGPHPVQSTPTFGSPFSVSSATAVPVTIDWHHSSSVPAVAEIFAELVSASPPVTYQIPTQWLTHSPSTLPGGWTLNADAGQASWVGLSPQQGSVMVFGTDGSGYQFNYAGNGVYTPPAQLPNIGLHTDLAGDYILDDPGSGLIYTFNSVGELTAIKSVADDLHPAALSYTYSGSPPLLTSITDPVDPTRTVDLIYGGSGNCPTPGTGFSPAPPGVLCNISFWDGTTTNLQYNASGELAGVTDPGNVNWQFAYDSNGRMTVELDPLPYEADVNGVRTDCATGTNCETLISYDGSGRAYAVVQPAPLSGGLLPERGYCYGFTQASITGTTVNCAGAAANVTSMAVAGLSPTAGYTEQVRYDARKRITSTRDSASLTTNYTWDTHDQLLSMSTPAGIESASAYDSQGHIVNSYGPAPASSYQANGVPIAGKGVATSTSVYDGGMSGLAAAWYPNPNVAGSPIYHSLGAPSESWAGGASPSSGTSEPTLVPSSGFSGHLSGLVTVPSNGRLSLDGDGGQVQIDGHPYINQMGGPYPSQVRQDYPSDWWQLGEAQGATIAADSAGADPGTYNSTSMPGQKPGPLADGSTAAAAFNGTSNYVTAADTPALEMSNTEAFSVEAWVKIPSSGFIQPIASKLTNNAALTGWEFGIYEGTPYLLLINNWTTNPSTNLPTSAIDVTSTRTVSDGNWHLLTVTYDGSSKAAGITFYVDGAATTKGTPYVDSLTASSVSSAPVTLGERGGYYLSGQMSDISVYPGNDLSASRVAAHYTAGGQTTAVIQGPMIYSTAYPQAVDTDTPVSYWRLSEAPGATTAVDSNGPNNGTYNSGVTLGGTPPVVGDASTSATFNGTNGTISVPDNPSMRFSNTQPFSVEAWVKTTVTSGTDEILSKMANTAPYQGWELSLANGEPFFMMINNWTSQNTFYEGATASVADGMWHHVVVTYDGSSKAAGVTFYVDGMPVGNSVGVDALTGTTSSTAPLYIGSRAGSLGFFNGSVADVAVYNQQLDASHIQSHYQAGVLGPLPQAQLADAPVSLWRLGEQSPAVEAGTNPAISSTTMSNGQPGVAYASANGSDLWTGPTYGPTPYTIAAGTNPSVAVLSNGNLAVAFQGPDGSLWTWTGAAGTPGTASSTGLAMAGGTSPSIAPEGGGTAAVAFQANGGTLWTWYGTPATTGSAASAALGMAAGTSPAIAETSGYPAAVAFQANTGSLWTWTGDPATTGLGYPANLGMAAGTSPAIIAIGTNNQYAAVAFQANTGALWTWTGLPDTTGNGQPTNMNMASGTSPSIATISETGINTGTVAVAVQRPSPNTQQLWTWTGAPTTTGAGASTNLIMPTGAGPAIAATTGGQVQVAFDGYGTNALWTWNGAPDTTGSGAATSSGGNGTATDVLNANPGSYQGGIKLAQPGPAADPGTAATFDGTSATVTVADSPTLEFANNQAFSLEAWIKTSATSGTGAIMSKMANAAPYQGWEFGVNNGEPYFYLIYNYPSSTIYTTANTSVADGKWHHLVLTYDGSSKAAGSTIYVDGTAVAQTVGYDTLNNTSASNAAMTIGSRADNALFFNGSIADAAVYPAALSSGQVGLHDQAGMTAPGPGAYATTHTVTVDDQQFAVNGHLNLTSTVSGTTFDPNYGLVTQTTDADGKVTATCYTDAASCNYGSTSQHIGPQYGLPTTVTQNPGGLNLTTTTTYETPGTGTYLRVLSKTLPAGSGPTYTYYANTAGPIAAVCGVSATTSQAGALEQRTDPAPATGSGDALEQQYVYDTIGRQVGTRTGTASTINTAGWACTNYDQAGRVTTQSYPGFGSAAARTVTYNYAIGNNPLVNSVTDTNWGSSTVASTVDLLGRITSYSDIWANTTATTYDQVGRVTATNGPQGALTYNFDSATGRPTSTILGGSTSLATDSYDSSGRLNVVYVDGTSNGGEVLYYDTNGRQYARSLYTTNVTSGEITNFSPAGRVVDQQVYANGSLADPNPSGPNYIYDGAGRLTQAILPGVTYNYSYAATTGCPQNNAGTDTNRTSLTVNTGTNTTTGYCYDNADRLTSTSSIPSGQVVYDGHGNMIQEGNESLTYDSTDQMSSDETPTYLDLYTRDPLNRPAQISSYTKITAGNTTTATVTAGSTITLNRPSGTLPGDELIASVTTSNQSGPVIPTGWQQKTSAQNGTNTTWIFAYTTTSSDPASWTFGTNATSVNIVGSIVDYHNPNATAPIDVTAAVNDPSSTTQPLPQVTTHSNADTILHVVGYSLALSATAPTGDTSRASLSNVSVAQVVSDRYQRTPGQTAAASASSTLAAPSEAITVALSPATAISRLGYTGETDSSGFTQNTSGTTIGTTIPLSGGVGYNTTPSGANYAYTNGHGDTILLATASNAETWTGYWGPYGETPPGITTLSDTATAGATLGYNGAQGKITEGNLVLMGARGYSPSDGRFIERDPVQGGCANDYTYGFGDPVNHPDLSGQALCSGTSPWALGGPAVNTSLAKSLFNLIVGGGKSAGFGILALVCARTGYFCGMAASQGNGLGTAQGAESHDAWGQFVNGVRGLFGPIVRPILQPLVNANCPTQQREAPGAPGQMPPGAVSA